jgi:2-iminobutanoate/2-iminopropanoate deaminase
MFTQSGFEVLTPRDQVIPPGLSQGLRLKAKTLVMLAGHVGLTASGKPADGFEAQLEQTFENIRGTLRAGGLSFVDVVRLTYFIVGYEPGMLRILQAARDRYVNTEAPPASTLVGVSALALPGLLVEIDGIAVAD